MKQEEQRCEAIEELITEAKYWYTHCKLLLDREKVTLELAEADPETKKWEPGLIKEQIERFEKRLEVCQRILDLLHSKDYVFK